MRQMREWSATNSVGEHSLFVDLNFVRLTFTPHSPFMAGGDVKTTYEEFLSGVFDSYILSDFDESVLKLAKE